MIIVKQCADGKPARIQARGNFSLGPSGLVTLLLALATVTLGLAGILAWRGYWPILTIAALQLVLIGWVLIRAWKNAWIVEDVVIGPREVRVRRHRYGGFRDFQLQAAWARVHVESPRLPGYAPRLMLRSLDQRLELGSYLTSDEKLRLAKHIADALSNVNAWR